MRRQIKGIRVARLVDGVVVAIAVIRSPLIEPGANGPYLQTTSGASFLGDDFVQIDDGVNLGDRV